MNIKLFFAPVSKGSKWKTLVRKDNPELNSDELTRVIAFAPDTKHIKDFKAVCKLRDEDLVIPFLYPAVVVLYPNCCLFASKYYPFPAVGSVHIFNTTTLYRKLTTSEKFTCVLKAEKSVRHAKRGSEVEFVSDLIDKDNKTVWSNSSKFLIMHNERKKLAEPAPGSSVAASTWDEPPSDSELTLLFEDVWVLGSNASTEYANVSKDYNPIHTSSIAAKLFGFPGIIMHGMYMITRAASECQRIIAVDSHPIVVTTKFQRPCVLPQKVTFKVYSIKGNKKHLYFFAKTKNDKVLLDGYMK